MLWERGGCWSRRNHAAKNNFDASFAELPSDRFQVEKKPSKFLRKLSPENFSSIQNAHQLSADNPETPSVCTFKTPQCVPSRTPVFHVTEDQFGMLLLTWVGGTSLSRSCWRGFMLGLCGIPWSFSFTSSRSLCLERLSIMMVVVVMPMVWDRGGLGKAMLD